MEQDVKQNKAIQNSIQLNPPQFSSADNIRASALTLVGDVRDQLHDLQQANSGLQSQLCILQVENVAFRAKQQLHDRSAQETKKTEEDLRKRILNLQTALHEEQERQDSLLEESTKNIGEEQLAENIDLENEIESLKRVQSVQVDKFKESMASISRQHEHSENQYRQAIDKLERQVQELSQDPRLLEHATVLSEKSLLEQQTKQLRNQLEGATRQLQSQGTESSGQISQLAERNKSLSQELDQLRNQHTDEMQLSKSKLNTSEKDNSVLRDQLDKSVTQQSKEKVDMASHIKYLNDALQNSTNNYTQKERTWSENNQKLKQDNTTLLKDIQNLTTKYTSELAEIKSELASTCIEKESLGRQLEQSVAERSRLETNLTSQIENSKRNLSSAQSSFENERVLSGNIRKLKEDNTILMKWKTTRDTEVQQLKANLDASVQHGNLLQQQLGNNSAVQSNEKAQLLSEIRRLNDELQRSAHITSENERLSSVVEKLKEDNAALFNRNTVQGNEMQSLKSKSQETAHQNDVLKRQLGKSAIAQSKEKDELSSQIRHLSEKLGSPISPRGESMLVNDLETLQKENARLLEMNTTQDSEIRALKLRLDQFNQQNDLLKKQLESSEHDYAKETQELSNRIKTLDKQSQIVAESSEKERALSEMVEKLKRHNDDLLNDIKNLETRRSTVSQLQASELERFRLDNAELLKKVKETDNLKNQLAARDKWFAEQKMLFEQQVRDLEAKHRQVLNEFSQQTKVMIKQKDSYIELVNQQNDEITQLKTLLEEAKQKSLKLKQAATESQHMSQQQEEREHSSFMDELKATYLQKSRRLEVLEQENLMLKASYQQRDSDSESLTSNLTDLRRKLEQYDKENAAQQVRILSLQTELAEKNVDLAVVTKSNDELQRDLKSSKHDLEKTSEIDQAEMILLRSEVSRFESETSNKNDQISRYESEISNKNEQMLRYESGISNKNEQISRYESEISGKNDQMSRFDSEISYKNEQISKLQDNLQTSSQSFNKELQHLKLKVQDYEKVLSSHGETSKIAEFDNATLRRQIDEIKASYDLKLRDAESKLVVVKQKLRDTNKKVLSEEDLEKLIEENSAPKLDTQAALFERKHREALRKQQTAKLSEIEELTTQLEKLSASESRFHSREEPLRSRIIELTNTLETEDKRHKLQVDEITSKYKSEINEIKSTFENAIRSDRDEWKTKESEFNEKIRQLEKSAEEDRMQLANVQARLEFSLKENEHQKRIESQLTTELHLHKNRFQHAEEQNREYVQHVAQLRQKASDASSTASKIWNEKQNILSSEATLRGSILDLNNSLQTQLQEARAFKQKYNQQHLQMEKLHKEIRDLEGKYTEQLEKVSELSQQTDKQKEIIENQNHEIETLRLGEQSVDSVGGKLQMEELSEEIQCLEDKCAEQLRKVSELSQETGLQKETIEKQNREIETLRLSEQGVRSGEELEKEKLREEIRSLNQKVLELSQETEQQKKTIANQTRVVETLRLGVQDAHSVEVNSQMEKLCEEIRSLEDKCAKQSRKVSELSQETAQQKETIENQSREIGSLQLSAQNARSIAEEHTEKPNEEIRALNQKHSEQFQKVSKLSQETEQQKDTIENQSRVIETLRLSIQDVRSEGATFQMGELSEKIQSLEDECSKKLQKVAELSQEVEQQRETIETQNREIETLRLSEQEARSVGEKQAEKFMEEIRNLKQRCAKRSQQIFDQSRQITEYQNREIETLRSNERTLLLGRVNSLSGSLNKQKSECEEMERQLQDADDASKKADAEYRLSLDNSKSEILNLRQILEGKSKIIDTLTTELEEVRQEPQSRKSSGLPQLQEGQASQNQRVAPSEDDDLPVLERVRAEVEVAKSVDSGSQHSDQTKEELADLKQRLDHEKVQNQKLNYLIQKLTNDLEISISDCTETEDRVFVLESELEQVERQKASLDMENQKSIQELKSTVLELRDKVAKYQELSNTQKVKLEVSEKEVDLLSSRLREVQSSLDSGKHDHETREIQQTKQATQAHEQAMRREQKLKTKVEGLTDDVETERRNHRLTSEQNGELVMRLQSAHQEIFANAHHKEAELLEAIVELKDNLATERVASSNRIHELEKHIEVRIARIGQLEVKIQNYSKIANEQEQKKIRAEEELQTYQEKLQKTLDSVYSLKIECLSLRRQNKSLTDIIIKHDIKFLSEVGDTQGDSTGDSTESKQGSPVGDSDPIPFSEILEKEPKLREYLVSGAKITEDLKLENRTLKKELATTKSRLTQFQDSPIIPVTLPDLPMKIRDPIASSDPNKADLIQRVKQLTEFVQTHQIQNEKLLKDQARLQEVIHEERAQHGSDLKAAEGKFSQTEQALYTTINHLREKNEHFLFEKSQLESQIEEYEQLQMHTKMLFQKEIAKLLKSRPEREAELLQTIENLQISVKTKDELLESPKVLRKEDIISSEYVQDLDKKLTESSEKLKLQIDETDRLRGSLNQRSDEMVRLKENLNLLVAQVDEYSQRNTELSTINNGSEKQIQELTQLLKTTTLELQQRNEQIGRLERVAEEHLINVTALTKQLDQSHQMEKELEESLLTQTASLLSDLSTSQASYENLSIEFSELKLVHEQHQVVLQKHLSENASLKQELDLSPDDKRRTIIELTRLLESERTAASNLRQQNDQLEIELDNTIEMLNQQKSNSPKRQQIDTSSENPASATISHPRSKTPPRTLDTLGSEPLVAAGMILSQTGQLPHEPGTPTSTHSEPLLPSFDIQKHIQETTALRQKIQEFSKKIQRTEQKFQQAKIRADYLESKCSSQVEESAKQLKLEKSRTVECEELLKLAKSDIEVLQTEVRLLKKAASETQHIHEKVLENLRAEIMAEKQRLASQVDKTNELQKEIRDREFKLEEFQRKSNDEMKRCTDRIYTLEQSETVHLQEIQDAHRQSWNAYDRLHGILQQLTRIDKERSAVDELGRAVHEFFRAVAREKKIREQQLLRDVRKSSDGHSSVQLDNNVYGRVQPQTRRFPDSNGSFRDPNDLHFFVYD